MEGRYSYAAAISFTLMQPCLAVLLMHATYDTMWSFVRLLPYSTYYPPMGGPLKCQLKEGGGRIIRSFCNRDVVSTHSNTLCALQLHRMQTASIRVRIANL